MSKIGKRQVKLKNNSSTREENKVVEKLVAKKS